MMPLPLQFLLFLFAGWVSRHQQEMIEYLQEENRVLREQLSGKRAVALDRASRFQVRLPSRSPNLNAYAEQFVRSIESECVAQVIPLGERHLRRVIGEYVEHYHVERNHQGLGNALIEYRADGANRSGAVQCREPLGGLLRGYRRAA
jgi:hypothetical protein